MPHCPNCYLKFPLNQNRCLSVFIWYDICAMSCTCITYTPVSSQTITKSNFVGIVNGILEFVISLKMIKKCWWLILHTGAGAWEGILILRPMKRFLDGDEPASLLHQRQFGSGLEHVWPHSRNDIMVIMVVCFLHFIPVREKSAGVGGGGGEKSATTERRLSSWLFSMLS